MIFTLYWKELLPVISYGGFAYGVDVVIPSFSGELVILTWFSQIMRFWSDDVGISLCCMYIRLLEACLSCCCHFIFCLLTFKFITVEFLKYSLLQQTFDSYYICFKYFVNVQHSYFSFRFFKTVSVFLMLSFVDWIAFLQWVILFFITLRKKPFILENHLSSSSHPRLQPDDSKFVKFWLVQHLLLPNDIDSVDLTGALLLLPRLVIFEKYGLVSITSSISGCKRYI